MYTRVRPTVYTQFDDFLILVCVHPGMLNLVSAITVQLGKTKLRKLFPSLSAGSSQIKIMISSWHKSEWDLWNDEVRILIFDDPAEEGGGNVYDPDSVPPVYSFFCQY